MAMRLGKPVAARGILRLVPRSSGSFLPGLHTAYRAASRGVERVLAIWRETSLALSAVR
jgi:hypothetical protein